MVEEALEDASKAAVILSYGPIKYDSDHPGKAYVDILMINHNPVAGFQVYVAPYFLICLPCFVDYSLIIR